MKLYLVRPIVIEGGLWDPPYDKCHGVVVRAETEQQARTYASTKAMDEGRSVWLSSQHTTCEEITQNGEPGVIIVDVHAG
jgi:hypothetical protein